MPSKISLFSSSPSPPRTAALDTGSDKSAIRRTSLSKANQKLQQIFTSKNKVTDAQALQAANAAQLAYLQSHGSSPLSLPTISLSAPGERSANDHSMTLFSPPSPTEARRIARQHAQFGPLSSPAHKYSSRHVGGTLEDPIEDEPPLFFIITTYISWLLLIMVGHTRDFFGKRFKKQHYQNLRARDGYAPLNSDFDSFYTRRAKARIHDCFARPVSGVPGRFITLVDRESDDNNKTFRFTGTTTETLNLSSYNYLGFAQSEGPCADAVEASLRKYGTSFASPRGDVGTSELHLECEELVAKFVGKEASMVFSMGFGTNATLFPAIMGKGCLILSDELNHSSIRTGMRLSGAIVEAFKHNDMKALERRIREAISQGQPRTHRPWKKILIAVEGLYSMEGTMCNLPALVELRRKYKCYLFVDEAHSIGALGPLGRGVCDYFGIDPNEVDILMGTLTKSFGANGGYVAADKVLIDQLRATNAGTLFGEVPAPPTLVQINTALRIIIGELCPGQGEERLQRLAFNSRYLRLGLKRLGFIITGHDDSPIIPLILYHPGKIAAFSHEMLRRKISVVVVGYPATPLITSRARFCVSAAHTKEDLDRMLEACDAVGDAMVLKYSTGIAGGQEPLPEGATSEDEAKTPYSPPRWKLQDVIARGVQDVKVPLR